ncbi:MAG TPA: hypothetical protein VIF12_08310 [Micavibrio sp.]|jgi:hypothetical protein
MKTPAPFPGLVIGYSYLWHHDYKLERDFSEKPATHGIVLSVEEEVGDKIVIVAALADAKRKDGECIELPEATRVRLGLPSPRYWIILSEINRFVWPGPDLRSVSPLTDDGLSAIPPALFETVKSTMRALSKRDQLKAVTHMV